VSFWPWSN